MEFSRQGYWSALPYPSPGDLLHPGIEPGSPALKADSLPSEPLWKPMGSLPRAKYCSKFLRHINPFTLHYKYQEVRGYFCSYFEDERTRAQRDPRPHRDWGEESRHKSCLSLEPEIACLSFLPTRLGCLSNRGVYHIIFLHIGKLQDEMINSSSSTVY